MKSVLQGMEVSPESNEGGRGFRRHDEAAVRAGQEEIGEEKIM